MDDVPPLALPDHTGDTRRKVVILTAGPSGDSHDRHAIDNLVAGTTVCAVGGQNRDLKITGAGQALAYFVHVRLDATHVG
jgi:hypothetical protein